MPASADDVARSIEPGSTEFGDRQVLEDQIGQIMGNAAAPTPAPAGAASSGALGKLSQGAVSDKPVTDGLSVGPGAPPANTPQIANSPRIDQLRIVAQNARSPRLRALARDLLRVEAKRV